MSGWEILSYHNVRVPEATAHSLYTVRTSADLSLRSPVLMIAARGAPTDFASLYGFLPEQRPGLEIYRPAVPHKGLSGVLRRRRARRWIRQPRTARPLVYVSQARPLRWFAEQKRSGRRFTLVLECHGTDEAWGEGLSALDGVLYTSASLRDAMLGAHPVLADRPGLVSPHRVERVPQPGEIAPPASSEPFVIGYVGSIQPWKGLETLVDAAFLLPESVRVRIVGGRADDPYRRELVARCERVEWLPFVSPAELPGVVEAMGAFVLPLPGEKEGSAPMKLVEYLAWGRPVLASDLPSIREVLRDGESGVLFVPGSVEGLVAAIRRVAALSGEQRASLVAAGLGALRGFDRDAWLERLFGWLDESLVGR